MHTVFALLCFVVVIHWLIFPYPSGLLHWHCGNLTIAPVPAKQPWWIWINTSCEFIMNDCITTTKQSTTKPCAYFLGYTVYGYQYTRGLCLYRSRYHCMIDIISHTCIRTLQKLAKSMLDHRFTHVYSYLSFFFKPNKQFVQFIRHKVRRQVIIYRFMGYPTHSPPIHVTHWRHETHTHVCTSNVGSIGNGQQLGEIWIKIQWYFLIKMQLIIRSPWCRQFHTGLSTSSVRIWWFGQYIQDYIHNRVISV